MRALALGFSLRPRFMFCMRALAFSAKWLGIPIPLFGELNGASSYPSQDLCWGPNGSACAVPIGNKQTASAANKAARMHTALRRSRIIADTICPRVATSSHIRVLIPSAQPILEIRSLLWPLTSASASIPVLRPPREGPQHAFSPAFPPDAARFDVCRVDHLRVRRSHAPPQVPEKVFSEPATRLAHELVVDRHRRPYSSGNRTSGNRS